ncbi:MAG: lysophospholipid acyltransferase family protein [Planctomycetota bacterium]|nr:lysophospholipid acyltransferase family protein [Planctomycetota bacterium]
MSFLREFAARAPGRPIGTMLWFEFAQTACGFMGAFLFGLRVRGKSNIPATGPIIFVGNHQSYLDPIFDAIATSARPPRPMARASLFRFPPLGWLLRSLGIVPVRMDGGAMTALRTAIDELAAGRTVLLFPEGTRSSDGEVAPFRAGLSLLVRRSDAVIIPIAIDGAFQMWPRQKSSPRLGGPVWIIVGEPISSALSKEWFAEDPDAALERIRTKVCELHSACRARVLSTKDDH